MATTKRRRSDYAGRIAARRADALKAYCEAVGGPKSRDARVRRIAGDAGVQPKTFEGYLSGKYDMGRKGCEALAAKLADAEKNLADYATDPQVKAQGVWIFANPRRKTPFMPQAEREARAAVIVEVLTGIVRDLSGDTSSEESILSAIAGITELKYNSVVTVARSCSYFGASAMEKLRAKLASVHSTRDISILGQDPRSLSELGEEAEDEATDGEGEADEPEAATGGGIREFAAVLATLKEKDVLIVTGAGAHQMVACEEGVVIVLTGDGRILEKSIPAGCVVREPTVMQSANGAGIVSVPFEPAPPSAP